MENSLIEQLTGMTEALLSDSAVFLVDLKIKPTNNVKVFIDGDTGVSIDVISKINRALYKQLEESALFPDGDFSLEVSSPGLDEPLRFFRQYKKNIGRKVEVTLQDDTVLFGLLKEVDEAEITLQEEVGKKKEIKETNLPFDQIKKTIVQISF
jgi:ribosome maturation factor RimP